ncbi:DNA repair protein RecO [Candidatus Parcubacteria bacterium]|nr:DNA repair protein RecO [Candidatus Parcubacteria bacterium]
MYRGSQGIILKKQDFRESDSFFSIYTYDFGKIEAIARGVKKSKSKLSGHLDYFSIIDLMAVRGKIFNHISGAVSIKNFLNIKKNLQKINLIFYCLEITDYFIKTGEKNKKIFLLLSQFLMIADKNLRIERLKFIAHCYILKLLNLLGYKPELYFCLKCGQKITPNGNFFSVLAGGIFCAKCKKNRENNIFEISNNAIKLLRVILQKNLSNLVKVKLSKNLFTETIKIIDEFLNFRLDKDMKSRKFIKF